MPRRVLTAPLKQPVQTELRNNVKYLHNSRQSIDCFMLANTTASLTTDKPVALGFWTRLEFRNVGFYGEEKTGLVISDNLTPTNSRNPLYFRYPVQ